MEAEIDGRSSIVSIVMFIILAASGLVLFFERFTAKYCWTIPEIEREQIWLGVRNDHSRINYLILFKIGCPTTQFDLNDSFINFEILGPDHTSQGIETRFNCSQIADPSYCELSVDISRVSEMSPISGIRAYHGSNDGEIFFFEYVCAVGNDESVIQRQKIFEYITRMKKDFVGVSLLNKNTDNLDALAADVPVPDMKNFDTFLFSLNMINVSAFFTGLFYKHRLYFVDIDVSYRDLFIAIQIIVLVSVFLGLFYTALIFIYKFLLLRKILREQVNENSRDVTRLVFFKHAMLTALVILTTVSFILTISVFEFDYRMSILWYSALLNITIILLGLWSFISTAHCIRNMTEAERLPEGSVYGIKTVADSLNVKTVLFSECPLKKFYKESDLLSVPRFNNPEFTKKCTKTKLIKDKPTKKMRKHHRKSK